MKKSAWITIGLLVVLVGVFFAVRRTPQKTIHTPLTIHKVADLSRVEIVPAKSAQAGATKDGPKDGAAQAPKLVVFEKKDDGWWLTRPLKSKVSESTARTLGDLFAKKVRTDDLDFSAKKAKDYGLDDDSVVKVSAYGKSKDSPALELEVGKEISIPQTHVQRTYIRKPGKDKIYRAQMALGRFVRKPVSAYRSREIAKLDEDAITDVTIAESAAAATKKAEARPAQTIHLHKDGDDWKMVEPKLDAAKDGKLSKPKVASLVRSLAHLRANGFADGTSGADAGFEPARATLTIKAGDKTHTLVLGTPADKKNYVQFDGGTVYTLPNYSANRLVPTIDKLMQKEKKKPQKTAKK